MSNKFTNTLTHGELQRSARITDEIARDIITKLYADTEESLFAFLAAGVSSSEITVTAPRQLYDDNYMTMKYEIVVKFKVKGDAK